jgi:D-alanine--poly(phosphoribitol) ligase subunit 1
MDVVDRFLKTVASRGDQTAVRTPAGQTSYHELADLTRRFAAHFSTLAAPRVLVAYDQGPYAYAAMLGTMLAGGFYVPVNVAAPRERLATICKSFVPDFIVGESSLLTEMHATRPEAASVSASEIGVLEPMKTHRARHRIAYVIFTSGSTGQPKGVVIPHQALAHYIDWVIDSGVFSAHDCISQYSNIAFDLSVLEIFGTLCAGGTLVPFNARSERLMPAETVRTQRITVWVSVPSVISLMAGARQLTAVNLSTVRRFFFCGEPLLETHVKGIFAACPNAEIWNSYGPTETTVSVTCLKLTADSYSSATITSVALGSAIPGMELHLIGGDSPDSGEIVITGPQLAIGYWNAADQTAKAFRDLDASGVRRRSYFSGDWGRMLNGHLFFESRVDHQVKIHGFRVELDEVASAIRSLGWDQVVVLKLNGELTAVLEGKKGAGQANPKELHARLWEKLDHYAIPSRFITVDEFPRNQNDKIDIKGVAALAAARFGERE